MVKIIVVVPEQFESRILTDIVAIRDKYGAQEILLEVQHDQAVIDEMIAGFEEPVQRVVTGATARRRAQPRAQAQGQQPVAMTAVAQVPRNAVVYRVLPGAENVPAGQRIDQMRTFILNSRRPLSARELQEALVTVEGQSPEYWLKAVQSALHDGRTKGIFESIDAVQVQPVPVQQVQQPVYAAAADQAPPQRMGWVGGRQVPVQAPAQSSAQDRPRGPQGQFLPTRR